MSSHIFAVAARQVTARSRPLPKHIGNRKRSLGGTIRSQASTGALRVRTHACMLMHARSRQRAGPRPCFCCIIPASPVKAASQHRPQCSRIPDCACIAAFAASYNRPPSLPTLSPAPSAARSPAHPPARLARPPASARLRRPPASLKTSSPARPLTPPAAATVRAAATAVEPRA
jgi:hypothetical protein